MPSVDLLTDFQLQIEHVVDFVDRERIIFVDASISATAPFEFTRIKPEQDDSYTTHAMSPQSLLAVYQKVNAVSPPPAFMLSIRAYKFDLGTKMTVKASDNLSEAYSFLKQRLTILADENWTGINAIEAWKGDKNA